MKYSFRELFAIPPSKQISKNIGDEELHSILSVVETFDRTLYNIVMVIDFNKGQLLYVSDNIKYICGADSKDVVLLGEEFYSKYIDEVDLKRIITINKRALEFFDTLEAEDKRSYVLTYYYYIRDGRLSKLINQRLSPIVLDESGNILLALCVMSIPGGNCPRDAILKKNGADYYFRFDEPSKKWIKESEVELSFFERQVLVLSAQGYTMEEISERICRSIDSVKTYKRKIFKKLGVRNIMEALTYSQTHKLL